MPVPLFEMTFRSAAVVPPIRTPPEKTMPVPLPRPVCPGAVGADEVPGDEHRVGREIECGAEVRDREAAYLRLGGGRDRELQTGAADGRAVDHRMLPSGRSVDHHLARDRGQAGRRRDHRVGEREVEIDRVDDTGPDSCSRRSRRADCRGRRACAVVRVGVRRNREGVRERRRREGKRKQSHKTHAHLAAASLCSPHSPFGSPAAAAVPWLPAPHPHPRRQENQDAECSALLGRRCDRRHDTLDPCPVRPTADPRLERGARRPARPHARRIAGLGRHLRLHRARRAARRQRQSRCRGARRAHFVGLRRP